MATHPRHAVTLGPHTYPHRGAALQALKDMLRLSEGRPIKSYPHRLTEADAAAVLAALAVRGPSLKVLSVGRPVAVEVRLNAPYWTPGMWVIGETGREVSVSIKHAFAAPPAASALLMDALRYEVSEQVLAMRAAIVWPSACALTGQLLYPHEAHIDHAHPLTFVEIARRWLDHERLDASCVRLQAAGAGVIANRIADRDLAASWQRWHQNHASLRVVCAKTNARNGARAPEVTHGP
jgi:hypothetical protein